MQSFQNWARTSPMGWNSWDCFGASVNENEVRANAKYVADHLKTAGYEYIIVDIQWYEPTADSLQYHDFANLSLNSEGIPVPSENRFPSSKNGLGFRPLSEYVHSLGLKFGIHMLRGIPRQTVHDNLIVAGGAYARDIAANNICPWNSDMYGLDMSKPGAQEYYNAEIKLYASWGIDFLKVDDIADSTLYGMHNDEINAVRKAIDLTNRPIVLSLSPGPADPSQADFLSKNANMWRLTNDFWDTWEQLRAMCGYISNWLDKDINGAWLDCDMLPVGAIRQRSRDHQDIPAESRFTSVENRFMFIMWCFVKSPLFLGGDLQKGLPFFELFTDPDFLRIHQNITNVQIVHGYSKEIFVLRGELDGKMLIAMFNISGVNQDVSEILSAIDERVNWDNFEIEQHEESEVMLSPHDARVFIANDK